MSNCRAYNSLTFKSVMLKAIGKIRCNQFAMKKLIVSVTRCEYWSKLQNLVSEDPIIYRHQ